MELIPAVSKESGTPFRHETLDVKIDGMLIGRIQCVDYPTRPSSRWFAWNSNGKQSGPYSQSGALDWVQGQYK